MPSSWYLPFCKVVDWFLLARKLKRDASFIVYGTSLEDLKPVEFTKRAKLKELSYSGLNSLSNLANLKSSMKIQ